MVEERIEKLEETISLYQGLFDVDKEEIGRLIEYTRKSRKEIEALKKEVKENLEFAETRLDVNAEINGTPILLYIAKYREEIEALKDKFKIAISLAETAEQKVQEIRYNKELYFNAMSEKEKEPFTGHTTFKQLVACEHKNYSSSSYPWCTFVCHDCGGLLNADMELLGVGEEHSIVLGRHVMEKEQKPEMSLLYTCYRCLDHFSSLEQLENYKQEDPTEEGNLFYYCPNCGKEATKFWIRMTGYPLKDYGIKEKEQTNYMTVNKVDGQWEQDVKKEPSKPDDWKRMVKNVEIQNVIDTHYILRSEVAQKLRDLRTYIRKENLDDFIQRYDKLIKELEGKNDE